MYNANIDNPQDVNKFIVEQTNLEMGGNIVPIISNAGALAAPDGTYIYAIKADGAANLVMSSIKAVSGTEAILAGGSYTILAGDVLIGSFSAATITSGKYFAYLRNKS